MKLTQQQVQIAVTAIRTARTHFIGLRATTDVKGNAPAAPLSKTGDMRQTIAFALSTAVEHWPGNDDWQIVGSELIDAARTSLPPGFIVMRQPIVLGEFSTAGAAA